MTERLLPVAYLDALRRFSAMQMWSDQKVEQNFLHHPAHNGTWINVMFMQNLKHLSFTYSLSIHKHKLDDKHHAIGSFNIHEYTLVSTLCHTATGVEPLLLQSHFFQP